MSCFPGWDNIDSVWSRTWCCCSWRRYTFLKLSTVDWHEFLLRFDINLAPCVEVHVSQTVVDAKVLDMEEMVICVEVPSVFVSWLLRVTKLVVEAKLEHLNRKNIIWTLIKTAQNIEKGNWLHSNADQLKSLRFVKMKCASLMRAAGTKDEIECVEVIRVL